MSEPQELLEHCEAIVQTALRLGADQAEVFASARSGIEVDLQKDDLHTASSAEETSFGVRVFRGGAAGFAAVNGLEHAAAACRDALAMATAAPADPHNGLAEPVPVLPLEREPDPALGKLDIERLVELATALLAQVKARDGRVRVDSGGVSMQRLSRAIASSAGVRQSEASTRATASLMGMAVDGSDVGSFHHDSVCVLEAANLQREASALGERWVDLCVGALGARKGESFRGTVVLAPEVVSSFVLGNLLPVLSAHAVRTGRSPLAGKLGQRIASLGFTLHDEGRLARGAGSCAFDREGMPAGRTPLIVSGELGGFLYDVYEGRAVGARSTGNACGGATDMPRIGAHNLVMEAGTTPTAELCSEPERAIWVSRLSGSSSPVTGEFSGVVKGGCLLHRGERIPVRETLIAGNLYELLRSVRGMSRELRCLHGRVIVPALSVDGISVTAG